MAQTLSDPRRDFRSAIEVASVFVALIWAINLSAWVLGWPSNKLGIYPGDLESLPSILSAPLIHGGFAHLVSNTLPLLLLGTFVLYGYPRARVRIIGLIWLGSGVGVWMTAREAFHFGASGLTHGLMFFLLISGFIRRDKLAITLAMLAFFLYGGMVYTIFPRDPDVSFESHFWGALMGLVAAFAFSRMDPPLPRRRYSWEYEDEEDEDPLIGEAWRSDEPEVPPPDEEEWDDRHR